MAQKVTTKEFKKKLGIKFKDVAGLDNVKMEM